MPFSSIEKFPMSKYRIPSQVAVTQIVQPIVAGAALSFGVLLVLAVSNGIAQLLFNQTVEGFVNKRVGA